MLEEKRAKRGSLPGSKTTMTAETGDAVSSWSPQAGWSWWNQQAGNTGGGWHSSRQGASSQAEDWDEARQGRRSDWEEVRPIAEEWWAEQNKRAKKYGCKPPEEDDKVCELWQSCTTDQISYIIGGGPLLRGPDRDITAKSKSAAMFMVRLRQFREQFPDLPQTKGKGKRKSKGEDDWKQKIMKTASGQRIQERLAIKGKYKGGKGGKGKEMCKGKAEKGPAGAGKDKKGSAGPGKGAATVPAPKAEAVRAPGAAAQT